MLRHAPLSLKTVYKSTATEVQRVHDSLSRVCSNLNLKVP
jgi:hypothetical protein